MSFVMKICSKTESFLIDAVNICKRYSDKMDSERYDIVLFSLPYWDIYTPFSAVPCLVGALKEKGWKAKNFDLGILHFHTLFEKRGRLAWALVKSKFFYRAKVQPFENSGVRSYDEYLASINWLSSPEMDFAALRKVYPALTDFQRGVLGAFYGALWINKRKRPNRRTLHLSQLIENYDFSPFLDVIRRFNLFPVLNNLPRVAGISITSLDQLAASCLWALFLKKMRPDITLVAGGSCPIILRHCNKDAWEEFFNIFDYMCTGEGEICTTSFMEHIYNDSFSVAEIPNLAYRDGNTIICTNETVEDIESLPPPCYDDVDQSLYLTPEPMLSYQTSRGCFWGKCAFCDFDKKWRTNFRQKSVEKVNADLKYLHDSYGAVNFTLVDEALEPRFFARWIPELEKEEFSRQIHWLAYMKVSSHYTDELVERARRCGLTMVMLGVESFNQRLLRFIHKGILAKNSIENLRCFHAHGVKTHAWLMAILPSQTKEELLEDFTAIQDNMSYIDNVALGQFMLLPSTDMFADPAAFNILEISEAPDKHYDAYDFISNDREGNKIASSDLEGVLRDEIRPFLERKRFISNRYDRFFDAAYYQARTTAIKTMDRKD